MEQEVAKKENIWNIPNFITLWRVIFTFLTIYFVLASFDIKYVVGGFIAAMITDTLDGQAARRFKMTTEFGRKFDVLTDRLLMLGVAIPVLIKFTLDGVFIKYHLLQIILILSREIIALPFVIYGLLKKKAFPPTRFLGKLTTVLQAFAFPAIILSAYYSFFNFSIYLAIITCLSGLGSSYYYIGDVLNNKSQRIKGNNSKII